ncbi:two-component system sensor histidine kinase NtrB [Pseudomonas alkylphenolica]|uniref:two-component system sensor histidine kinase NtrB n=1 Tax=Pseudomonas alkylphenolica TaxID=237609 RepID=UPI0018D85979|nr:PAS domain S-box protein [Pseudomonas alkylphenolica]MBH3429148.1 PAS domain S-box protein [Pseudomonas alkylphenolica]
MSSSDRTDTLQTSPYEQLVQAVVDYAIYMLDPQGHIVSWNAGAQRIKGWRAEEVIGKHFSLFFTEQDRAEGRPAMLLERALSTGVAQDEGWRVRKDGTRFWALAALDVIRSPDGKIIGLAKITRDITDRLEAAQQLDAMRAQLFQAQKLDALGQLTGGMAHDFNNLLTIIIGSAKLALGSQDSQRVHRLLEHIIDAGERGAQMTQQLLSFARHKALKSGRVRLSVLMESSRLLLGHALPKGVELQVRLEEGLQDVDVDGGQLQMVLVNLILNARDALDGEGVICLQGCNCQLAGEVEDLHGAFVRLDVSDDGRGIAPNVLPRIFEPFFTTKAFGKGTGLGLSQVYGFIKQSNGAVTVASVQGEGTHITLYLPVFEANTAASN